MDAYLEEFEELWQLNETGDKSWVKLNLDIFIKKEVKNSDGELVDYKFLIQKYKEYMKYMAPKQRGQYTSKDDRIMSIMEFVDNQKYNHSFSGPRTARDRYIFGPFTDEELRSLIQEFEKEIGR